MDRPLPEPPLPAEGFDFAPPTPGPPPLPAAAGFSPQPPPLPTAGGGTEWETAYERANALLSSPMGGELPNPDDVAWPAVPGGGSGPMDSPASRFGAPPPLPPPAGSPPSLPAYSVPADMAAEGLPETWNQMLLPTAAAANALPPPLGTPPPLVPPPPPGADLFTDQIGGAVHWPGQRGSVHSAAAVSEIERMEERRRQEVEAAARLRMLQRQSGADRYASAGELPPGVAASAFGAAVPLSSNYAPPPLPSAWSPQQQSLATTAALSAPLDANGANVYSSPGPAARETIVCEGFLRKQGKSRESQWRRRWCILHPARLDYHKPSKRPPHAPQNRIIMESVLEVTVNTERHPEQFGFQLVTAEGVYAFQAIDATDQRRWVASMQSVVMTARRADGPTSTAGAGSVPPRSRLEADARAMLMEEDEMAGGSVTTTINATLTGSRFLHVALRHICGAGSNLLINVGRENEELVSVHSVDAADLGAGSQDASGIVTLDQPLIFAHAGGERVELLAAAQGHEVVDHVGASSAAAFRSPLPEQATFQLSPGHGPGHGGASPNRSAAAFPQPRLAGADATQRVLGTSTMLTPGAGGLCLFLPLCFARDPAHNLTGSL